MAFGLKKNIKVIMAILTLVLSIGLCQTPMNHIMAQNTGSITISYPVDKVIFDIYKIGESDHRGGYNLEEPYKSFGIDLKANDVAQTLEGYVLRNELRKKGTAVTGSDGCATFEQLPMGVYLILGETVTVNNITYTAKPVLVELPQVVDKKVVWDVIVEGKYDENPITEMTALKVWRDNEAKDRPESVVVQLLKNGKVEDEQKLNKENNWRYTWENLDAKEKWNIIEKEVPKGYKVAILRNKTVVGITNTKTTTPPGRHPGGGGGHSKGSIPKTGQLWWPIPILAFAGLLFILLGVGRRTKSEKRK